jgi:exopolysaccharide biosynthesis protein
MIALSLRIVLVYISVCAVYADAISDYGITYKTYRPRVDALVHVLNIDPQKVKIVAARSQDLGSGLDTVAKIAQQHGALAAINGGFFRLSPTNQSVGLPAGVLKINHQWLGIAYKARAAIGWDPTTNIVVMDILQTKSKRDAAKQLIQVDVLPQLRPKTAVTWDKMPFIVGGGPLLITNKKVLKNFTIEKLRDDFIYSRYARTAIGILPNKHWIFVVIEQNLLPDDSGFTLAELSDFMSSLGCIEAINLDGGGSSAMYVVGKDTNTLALGRPVADAILVLTK